MSSLRELLKKISDGIDSICTHTSPGSSGFKIGKSYFIRTISHHFTGRLVAVHEHELVITDAAWIADDGRFAQAVASGSFNEVEPYPDKRDVLINRASLIDACEITFPLPRAQK